MNNLQVFENEQFGQVRILVKDGEPWFVGKDVAKILGYTKLDAMYRVIDEQDKVKINPQNVENTGFPQNGASLEPNPNVKIMLIINESGLYDAIFASTLPQAKQFKRWVTSEVLPTIRKTGSYTMNQSPLEALKLMVQVAEENRQMIEAVNNDLQDFKQDMPILGIEESKITNAVRKRGIECLGGRESAAYNDRSLRGKIYSDIHAQLKRAFGVTSYKAIKRNQSDKALEVINMYEPPFVLCEDIEKINNQVIM